MDFGTDIGNGYVKYSSKGRFKSCIKRGVRLDILKEQDETYIVNYDNDSWIIGEGAGVTGIDRYSTKEYKIMLLTAIALAAKERLDVKEVLLKSTASSRKVEANIVIGVPPDHYFSHAVDIKSHLSKIGKETIVVDGLVYDIEIKNINIFVEGAMVIRDRDDSHVITIDIGSGTMNFIEWKNQTIINKYTHNQSCEALYTKVAKFLNETKKTRILPNIEGEKVLTTTLRQTKVGAIDVGKEIDAKVDEFIKDVIKSVEQDFDFDGADKIQIFGGGAIQTFPYWKKRFPKSELVENSQFVNQEVYESVAMALADGE